MKCLDFENQIIVSLTTEQKKHLKTCLKCRLEWEDRALEREIINTAFDPANEPVVDLRDKPSSNNWITPEFLQMLEEGKQENEGYAKDEIILKTKGVLARLYPANPQLQSRIAKIIDKMRSNLVPVPKDFDQRFVAALGYFSEQETEAMPENDLTQKILEKIEDQKED
jgi:hypothetical protein